MTTKTKIFALFLVALMSSVPAYAVSDPDKSFLHSVRNVTKIIEVVQNTSSLISSVQTSILQGSLATVKSVDFMKTTDLKSFAPSVPDEIKSFVVSKSAVPQVRSYIEKELKDVSFENVFEQRNALLDVSRRLNLSSMEAISLGKRVSAELNEAKNVNEEMLSTVADAINQQQKETQEAALGLKAMAEDAVLNQMRAENLKVQAERIVADVRKSAIYKAEIVESDQNADQEEQEDKK